MLYTNVVKNIMHNSFKPAWWLSNPHLQTIWPTLLRQEIKGLNITRERFELPDGDFIDCDWSGENKNKPIIFMLHGLEGTIDSPYVKGMMRTMNNNGWRSLFINFRGCSGERNRLSRAYHSGDTEDVEFIINLIKNREPNIPLGAIGFSLGGNVLLKWLGESQIENPLKAAVAVSVPFELAKSCERMNQGFSKIYQRHFLKALSKKMHWKFKDKQPPFAIESLKDLKTVKDFDDLVTAPMHGFKSADDYYTKSSSRQFLSQIAIPTLLLQSKDDPFMTKDLLPEHHELSKTTIFELTDQGGHLGFISGKCPWQPHYWLEERVPEFFIQHLF